MSAIQASINAYVASGYTSGVAVLVGHGDTAQAWTAGDVRRDSIFRIASLTKPITAVATLLLVQDGKLALDSSIEPWLPELANRRVLETIDAELDATVPAVRAITVHDLLTFRNGFGSIAAPPGHYPIQRAIDALELPGFGPPNPASTIDFDAYMRLLGTLPLMAQPGEQWFYSAGSNVLGVLIERLSGIPLGDFMRERIFAPLGMTDTGFWVPPATLDRLTDWYHRENGHSQRAEHAASSSYARPPVFAAGDAGLVSTLDDLFAFTRMLLRQGAPLLAASAVNDMMTDHITRQQRLSGRAYLNEGRGWGYGGAVVRETTPEGIPAGAFGWGGGLGASWHFHPQSRITAISLCTTGWESPDPPQLHKDVQRIAFA